MLEPLGLRHLAANGDLAQLVNTLNWQLVVSVDAGSLFTAWDVACA
jgi:outer membrane translocation and assembly module TamA